MGASQIFGRAKIQDTPFLENLMVKLIKMTIILGNVFLPEKE